MTATSRDDLEAYLAASRRLVDDVLGSAVPGPGTPPPVLHEAMRHTLLLPGKRLRGMLVLAACEACKGDPAAALPLACAAEMVHAASLILDDLPSMDNATLRRGKPALHRVVGVANAILAAVALLGAAFETARRAETLKDRARGEAVSCLAFAVGSEGMTAGQVLDLEASGRRLDLEGLESIHAGKTHLAGTRPPAIPEKFVTRDAVGLVYLDRASKRELLKAAGAALGGASPSPAAVPGRVLAGVASVAVALVTSAVLGVVSDWGHAAHASPGAELVVTFKHPGERSEVCRDRTQEELAQLPQHMRQGKVCERARAAVRLRVSVDGERRVDQAYSPSGIWSDGSSVAVVPFGLTPGEHAIRVEIGDSHDPDEWSHVSEQTIEFDERFRRVIAFDRASGFKLH